jgi:hypothetical protein
VAAGVPVHVAQVDLSRPEVHLAVATAGSGLGHCDHWSDLIERTGPVAALTGTYFCPQSALPVGTIIVDGRRLCSGYVGTALTFTRGSGARLVDARPGVSDMWLAGDMVLRAGPRLLRAGRLDAHPEREGFRDPAITACKRRTAAGITAHGKLLLVAVEQPVTLETAGRILRELGAQEALCLDGGTSSGLFCAGKTWLKPRRPLTNLLVVYDSTTRYQQYAGRLNPPGAAVARAPDDRGPG